MTKKPRRANKDRYKDLKPSALDRTPLELPAVEERTEEPEAITDPRHNVMAPKKKPLHRRPFRYRIHHSIIKDRNEAGEIKLTLWMSRHLYDRLIAKVVHQLPNPAERPITPHEQIRRLIKRWVANYPLPHPPTDPTRRNINHIILSEQTVIARQMQLRAKKAKREQQQQPE